MDRLTQKLVKVFLLSGTGFFIFLALLFFFSKAWPVIWDEWNDYKKGESLTAAKITQIRLYKNEYYDSKFDDAMDQESLHAWHDARKDNEMLSPNGASEFNEAQQMQGYSLRFIDLKDSVAYVIINNQFHPLLSAAPSSFYDGGSMPFPRDIITDTIQLQLLKNDSIITRFTPFVLQKGLHIGSGFKDRKNKEVKMVSDNNKIVLYVNFELE